MNRTTRLLVAVLGALTGACASEVNTGSEPADHGKGTAVDQTVSVVGLGLQAENGRALAGLELCQFTTTVNCRTTDANGSVSLEAEVDEPALWVGQLEGSRFMVQFTGPNQNEDMTASPLTVLTGKELASMRQTAGTKAAMELATVVVQVHGRGAPRAGLDVALEPQQKGASSEHEVRATTGADGRAYFMGVPVGDYAAQVGGACAARTMLGMNGPHDDDASSIVPGFGVDQVLGPVFECE